MLSREVIEEFLNNSEYIAEYYFNDPTSMVVDLEILNGTPFCFGAVNIVYGVQNYGKTYQTLELVSRAFANEKSIREINAFYLSNDGSMSKNLVSYCRNRAITPMDLDSISNQTETEASATDIITKVSTASRNSGRKTVFIIDSLSSFLGDIDINSSQQVGNAISILNSCAKINDCCLIVIDHATVIRDKNIVIGCKIEGNESGKLKYTATASVYEPFDVSNPSFGGTFTVTRSRVQDSVKNGTEFVVKNESEPRSKEAIDRLLSLKVFKNNFKDNMILLSKFTKSTQNKKDLWIRDYKDVIFDTILIDGATYLKAKNTFT